MALKWIVFRFRASLLALVSVWHNRGHTPNYIRYLDSKELWYNWPPDVPLPRQYRCQVSTAFSTAPGFKLVEGLRAAGGCPGAAAALTHHRERADGNVYIYLLHRGSVDRSATSACHCPAVPGCQGPPVPLRTGTHGAEATNDVSGPSVLGPRTRQPVAPNELFDPQRRRNRPQNERSAESPPGGGRGRRSVLPCKRSLHPCGSTATPKRQ